MSTESIRIETGPEGEPIVIAEPEKNLEKDIQAGMFDFNAWAEKAYVEKFGVTKAEMMSRINTRSVGMSGFAVPHIAPKDRTGYREPKFIEIEPGIMVSQHLIDEAVSHQDPSEHARYETMQAKLEKERAQIKEELSISKQIVQSMLERAMQPLNLDEKYISYDAMPAPLQRVVRAYLAASDANKELEAAVKALSAPSDDV